MGRVVKSLIYQVENAGHGYPHREHRSKKNRYKRGPDWKSNKDFKRLKEQLKHEDSNNWR